MKTRFLLLGLGLSLFLGVSLPAYGREGAPAQARRMLVFHSLTCHRCIQAKAEVLPAIEREFKGRITIEYFDTADVKNYKYLLSLKEKYLPGMKIALPVFFLEGKFLNGDADIASGLRALIAGPADQRYKEGGLPGVGLEEVFSRFNLLGVALAGLEDGINPCAFTVIVFFISYLALQGYRRRELLIIGLTFILTVFSVYLLIGLGLFNFLYALRGFWVVTRAINTTIGLLSIVLGICAFYDFYKFKRTGQTDGLILQLPRAVKNRIHSIIGLHYRKDRPGAFSPGLFKLLTSAFVTGSLVTLLEAVCTGQLYLPTILFILKTSPLKLEAAGYLVFYNLLFITPLFIVFIFSLLGVGSVEFSVFLKKHLGAIKLLMAAIFLGLGFVLLWQQAPHPAAPRAAQVNNPQQESPSDSWDFGRVKEGAVLKHSFTVRNNSRRTLRIEQVDTSCGCTVSQVEKNLLRPGENTSIEVTFHTKGYSGRVRQYVYVHTDDLDNPVSRLIINADVIRQAQ